jgi:hypothetical protein
MQIFNLYGDEWDEPRDRDGWRSRRRSSATASAAS